MARRALGRWTSRPDRFALDVLGYEPWDRQAEFLRAVATDDHTAIRSGHKCSKSTSLVTIALWWFCTRPNARVVFTAPSSHQILNIFWPEFRRLYLGARLPIGGHLAQDPRRGLIMPDGRQIFGLTTDTPERFAGLSGANLLFLVDEASGFPEAIFDAVFGNLAGGGKVVLAGNPTQTSGAFYDAFHSKRGSWKTLHVASTETPNFHGGNVPGLANPAWVEWAKGQWGEGTPAWDVRVLGNFPSQGANSVIALSLVEAANLNYAKEKDAGELSIGVDVGRFGDDPSVIQAVRGRKAHPAVTLHGQDGRMVAGYVLEVVREHRRSTDGKVRVKVDVIGVGASVADHLRGHEEIELVEVNVSERADDESKYHRLRDQLWFGAGDWLKEGGVLPPEDQKIVGDLVAPTYAFDSQGRYQVEPKEQTKRRLGRSPDRADALCLAVYRGTQAAEYSADLDGFHIQRAI